MHLHVAEINKKLI